MKKIIEQLINCSIENVDVYRWRGATWLIFTKETRWVVELTDEGTLWYNYRFFNDVFRYVSMEIGQQTEKYIIEWANGFFFKDCAHRATAYPRDKDRTKTSNVLEHGIKHVSRTRTLGEDYIEEVVNGGVKEVNQSDSIHRQNRAENVMNKIIKEVRPNRVTVHDEKMDRFYYDPTCTANFTMLTDIVEEGVKEAKRSLMYSNSELEYIVKKVKPNIEYSQQSGVFHPDCVANCVKIEKVIDEGVKEIKPSIWTTKRGVQINDLMCSGNTTDISSIVKSGVKNIYPDKDPDVYDWSDEFKADNVIQGGIKVIPLPDMSGELRGYSDYYITKEDRTKPHTEYVKDAIEGGEKI